MADLRRDMRWRHSNRVEDGVSGALAATALACVLALASPARAGEPLPKLPRSDVFAAYYLGFAIGPASLDASAERVAAAGSGVAYGLSLGMAFGHEFPVNLAFGTVMLKDRQPFSEFVVTCTQVASSSVCGNPDSQESTINGDYLQLDAGYQPRLQLSDSVALLPGMLVGYLWNGSFERGVLCDGCDAIRIDGVSTDGAYVAPTVRVVFTEAQFLALSARWQWFLSGDFNHLPVFGFEFLAP